MLVHRRVSSPVHQPRLPRAIIASAISTAIAAMPATAYVHGDLIHVTNCSDSGPGSLRDAVAGAVDGDHVVFDPDLGCSVVALTSGALTIANDTEGNPLGHIEIVGTGIDALLIDGGGLDRVFVHRAGADGELTLRNLSLTGGVTGDSGGCIFAEGDVILNQVSAAVCKAGVPSGDTTLGTAPRSGGAVYAGGLATLASSTFVSNRVYGYSGDAAGGAVFAQDMIIASDSYVRANFAFSWVGSANGGGLAAGDRAAANQASVTLRDSIVTDNTADSRCSACGAHGGGLWIYGSTSLVGGQVGSNSASTPNGRYGTGGGVYFYSDTGAPVTLTIVGTEIVGNEATIAGGIAARGDVVMAYTTLSSNFAQTRGGSIELLSGDLTVSDSAIVQNYAYRGGGIFVSSYSDVAITNSTIAGNISTYGAGIYNVHGALRITNSTIAVNRAFGIGGGVHLQYPDSIDVTSSIISGNTLYFPRSPDDLWPPGVVVTGSHNLIGAADGITLPADTLRGDAMLGSLANHGGLTPTMEPASGSPAIDTGINVFDLPCDQRGDGFAREHGGATDIGATEVQSDALTDHIFANGFDP